MIGYDSTFNNQHQLNCTRYFLIVKFYSVLFQTDRHVIKQYSGFIIGFIFLAYAEVIHSSLVLESPECDHTV